MIELTLEQKKVLLELENWFNNPNKDQFITLGGYAGTGKTTLISMFRKYLEEKKPKIKVIFCSYTGKAARVLKSKIVESNAVFASDTISTIHSAIYSPMVNSKEEIVGWEKKDSLEYNLIIVDEASMVDSEIWNDLLRYKLPIIAVGDHGQLPPIKGNFNLMENPHLRLEKIHRQAEENPIINLSIMAREKGEIPVGNYGDKVMKLSRGSTESQEIIGDLLQNYKKDTLVLCGYNTTRVKTNKYIRNMLEFEGDGPQTRDRVICLRNNHAVGIFNGMLGTIISLGKDSDPKENNFYNASIQMDDESDIYNGKISVEQFNNIESLNFSNQRARYKGIDLFDFGYAITVHKAQGSQAKRVILFEERFSKMDSDTWRRWLYTAVTRAESELFIVGS